MGSVEEKIKTAGEFVNGAPSILLDEMMLKELHDQSGARKTINSKLWHACAGPLVSLPQVGSLVYYFPQGHSEQVAVSTKRTATSHIPNYPSLPSQLMCQVHNVTLHAEKDTDEIYAQMTLQPVYSEKDVLPIPHFGQNPSKHPSEFFCKTLTASDTSTHGGFSVPRRAAEKLFPTLDYSMQPPTQELVVRDLHDNSWTFRHIYRGQPKRHLLTTGWSVFVGAKRLRAGDSVLFIRDEKSQLLVGVRRANHQQTSLPSSVLSADSMHIGVLAAAAHAAANRSPFTIFYNPRACPSEFVVPLSKCQKAIHGAQVTIGTRFGMMFETEESGKRRYMGTIVGISDLDPLRWPSSKWHNLQVEWDEPGSGEKQNRVSLWEIETPESLFIFPSLTSTLKRSFHPGFAGAETEWRNLIKRPFIRVPENGNSDLPYPPIPNLGSEQLLKMLFKPPSVSPFGTFSSALPTCGVKGTSLQARDTFPHILSHQKPQINNQNPPQNCIDPFHALDANLISQAPMSEKMQPLNKPKSQIPPKAHVEKQEIAQAVETDQLSQLTSTGMGGEKLVGSPLNNPNLVNQPLFLDQGLLGPQIGSSQLETSNLNGLLPYPSNLPSPYLNTDDWMLQPSSCQSHDGMVNPIMPSLGQELWGSQMNYPRHFSQVEELSSCILQQDSNTHQSISNSCGLKDFSEESRNQSELYNALHFEVSNGGSTIVDPSVSSTVLDGFGSLGDVDFPIPSGCFVGGFSSSQDVQSQITTASLADSQGFSLQEFPDNSGGTSSSNVDFDETNLFQKGSSWQQISQPMRTYTKVQKLGSVGRSIDVTRFKSYEELRYAIACMFGLKGLLDDPRGSEWKLVYVDYENDVLLVGDDPWEEFVTCVRCIKILSPSEVQQMSENGLELLNNTVV